MAHEIYPGEQVECTDGPLGTVERVVVAGSGERPVAIMVRHGRAADLLLVPYQRIATIGPSRVCLNLRFDDAEMGAIQFGYRPWDIEHVTLAGSTEPPPTEEEVLGRVAGQPIGGPTTG